MKLISVADDDDTHRLARIRAAQKRTSISAIPLRTAPRLPVWTDSGEVDMPRRRILSARQSSAPFDLPTCDAALLRHYTLSGDDIEHVRERRGGTSGWASRSSTAPFDTGRLPASGEAIPLNVLRSSE